PRTGQVRRIVEASEADPETQAIREVNSGLAAFRADWLWPGLTALQPRKKGEFFLTDLVEHALTDGRPVCTVQTDEPGEAVGINTQRELAEANRLAWDRESARLMSGGVTVLDPATTYVDVGVAVAAGTVIYPNTHLHGACRIAQGCQIGPNSIIRSSSIGERSVVLCSVVEDSTLESDVHVGPYSHLRPGCYLERGVNLGNYAEAKASRIGAGTQMHHF